MATLLALPLALVLGTLALVLARSRALARPLAGGATSPTPLDAAETARLRGWERRLRRAVKLVVVAYLAVLATWWAGADAGPVQPAAALLLLALACLGGAAVQFSERCPRCGYNLGFQARLLAAERCERCGIPFG
jgi:hypothetical protein